MYRKNNLLLEIIKICPQKNVNEKKNLFNKLEMESLMNQTNNELRNIARAEGVPYSKLNKAALVERILDYRATCNGKRVFDKNFIPDCFKTQEMCDKAVDEFPLVFQICSG